LRVFLDTNVLVSAFATRGLCTDLLRHVLAEHELVTGQVVLSELSRVLTERIHLPEETVGGILRLLAEYTCVSVPDDVSHLQVRDPDDAVVLASALMARADVLVTGDKDLLEMEGEPGIRIMKPRDFGASPASALAEGVGWKKVWTSRLGLNGP
jgi:putative PIN family toxin of toxin-antitoxin system